MTDTAQRRVGHVNSDGNAVKELSDAGFVAFVLVQACKLMIGMLSKRWPELR